MNRALPDILQCADVTVLEGQRSRMKWQHQEQSREGYFQEAQLTFLSIPPTAQSLHQFRPELPELSAMQGVGKRGSAELHNGWPDFGKFPVLDAQSEFVSAGVGSEALRVMDYGISRMASCPPLVGDVAAVGEEKGGNSALVEKMVVKESFKKRKADKPATSSKGNNDLVEDTRVKKIKADPSEEESKVTELNPTTTNATNNHSNNNSSSNNNRETSADTSKENSKVSDVQKPDYIHVRARRGQATDSHSLAERVRREKISERMKFLQDLVPGCNKITGKAGMLDEIINYVQSLQRQVEFLSMKLATVNPRLDFNIDSFFTKEMLSGCNGSFSTTGDLPELTNPALLQFNPMQQGVACCGLDMAINPPDIAIRRTTSAPGSLPDTFMDPYFHANGSSSNAWDIDLSTLYNGDFQQARQSVFPSQTFTGNLEVNNLKMEM